jgi:prepilin-type N-terminal cleavage/methylation domain-containing protein
VNLNYYKKINKGFSLIELVIVIAVLTILSAVAIPAFMGLREKAADTLVKVSMLNSWKECQVGISFENEIATFTADLGLNATNGFYEFYQQYDYIQRDDGYIPPTIIGNCIGPLGPHRIGVRKIKGSNSGGELWLNLSTGEKIQSGGLSWD